jgi:hypothetical protein
MRDAVRGAAVREDDMHRTRLAISVAALALALSACHRADQVATSAQKLTISTVNAIASTVSIVRSGPNTLVMGYEDGSGLTRMGWAFSVDNGQSWTPCNATGSPCAGVLPPIGQSSILQGWLGRPSLVSDGNGNVFYATLSDTDGDLKNGAERVTLALSSDGGKTFGQAQFVNFDPGCSAGQQDQPTLALDRDTLVIAWRNKTFNAFGGCIRRAHITTSPLSLSWSLGNSHGISNMDREGNGIPTGQALVVQARGDGSGVVSIVYSNNDHFDGCPSSSKSSMAWASVTSYDGGATWTNHSRFTHTDSFQGCLKRNGAKLQNVIRAFGFVRSPTDGHEWVAVNDSANTIRLFASATDGATWRELCGSPQVVWGGVSDPSQTAPACAVPFVTGADQFVYMPTLGVTSRGGIGLTFYQSEAGGTWSYVSRANKAPLDPLTSSWNPAWPGSNALTTGISLPSADTDFRFGQYASTAVDTIDPCEPSTITLFPAWTQSDSNGNQQIATTGFGIVP